MVLDRLRAARRLLPAPLFSQLRKKKKTLFLMTRTYYLVACADLRSSTIFCTVSLIEASKTSATRKLVSGEMTEDNSDAQAYSYVRSKILRSVIQILSPEHTT
jgi:hypothetical protein